MMTSGNSKRKGDPQTHYSVINITAFKNQAIIKFDGSRIAGNPAILAAISDVKKGGSGIMTPPISGDQTMCFAVQEEQANDVSEALKSRLDEKLGVEFSPEVEVIPNCIILVAFYQNTSIPGFGACLLDALAKDDITIIAQRDLENNTSVALKREDRLRALRAVHSRFCLFKTTIAMGIVGPGLIGATLLDQLRNQVEVLKKEFSIDLRVMGITGSRTMVLRDEGIDLSRWRELQKAKGEVADLEKFTQHVHGNEFTPNMVLVDCTADSKIASQYYEWLHKGIHVVTPNKKANSGPLDQYLNLRALQRQSCTHYFYEATVGAGLPIISTLRGLQETGDRILRIEGIFSGTLSYIFNSFIGERAFSEVVAEAKQAGYTEPDPRDDLSGTDVARKVIILARECGLKLELSDIPVQSLVPEPLQASSSAEEFMQKLPQFDQDMTKKRYEAETAGEVLRYVGVVDAVNGKGTVELRRYSKDHPFARLSGSDNIISFTTTLYKEHPLIIIGPGAGAEVTAGGVFSDILRLASYLGAPS